MILYWGTTPAHYLFCAIDVGMTIAFKYCPIMQEIVIYHVKLGGWAAFQT